MTDLGLVLVVILILAIIWRGPKTLPRIGEALGRGVKEARREAAETREQFSRPDNAAPTASTGPTPTGSIGSTGSTAPGPDERTQA